MGQKMQQSDRRSVHRRLLGTTSNTNELFGNYALMFTHTVEWLQSKYYCNSNGKTKFSTTTKAQRKYHQINGTLTDNRKWQCGRQTGNDNVSGTMTDSIEIPTANRVFDDGELDESILWRLRQ